MAGLPEGFDPSKYLELNPDLKAAFGGMTDWSNAAKDHYMNFGGNENRQTGVVPIDYASFGQTLGQQGLTGSPYSDYKFGIPDGNDSLRARSDAMLSGAGANAYGNPLGRANSVKDIVENMNAAGSHATLRDGLVPMYNKDYSNVTGFYLPDELMNPGSFGHGNKYGSTKFNLNIPESQRASLASHSTALNVPGFGPGRVFNTFGEFRDSLGGGGDGNVNLSTVVKGDSGDIDNQIRNAKEDAAGGPLAGLGPLGSIGLSLAMSAMGIPPWLAGAIGGGLTSNDPLKGAVLGGGLGYLGGKIGDYASGLEGGKNFVPDPSFVGPMAEPSIFNMSNLVNAVGKGGLSVLKGELTGGPNPAPRRPAAPTGQPQGQVFRLPGPTPSKPPSPAQPTGQRFVLPAGIPI